MSESIKIVEKVLASGNNQNSFIPALDECERFIKFLIGRFKLAIPNDYVITINKANKNTIGYFKSKDCEDNFINTEQDLNNINLNTLLIKKCSPYECLTHELAHFINYSNGITDCSSNKYHNKHFKVVAEMLGLEVKKGKRGFAETSESEEFNKMLLEFKPDKKVFDICQNTKAKKKAGSRLKLWMCSCGVRVRCAIDLNATCNDCGGDFEEVEK